MWVDPKSLEENKVLISTLLSELDKGNNKRAKKLVDHLLEKNWTVNINYIEQEKKKRKIKNLDVDFEAILLGKFKGDYHLTTKCKKYVVRITSQRAVFWKMEKWVKLGEFLFEDIELTEKGIKVGIVKIEVDDNEQETGS
ncbi:gp50 [Bacillus phage G]|uniref:Gp50 n=1 Tax=Bacillus phage G TaxID=2884420 RepID=G3MBC0_9CAUD|nr:gp50 [Bacillus phage G]AEO93321.1 gp50 [Bacillus phage G]